MVSVTEKIGFELAMNEHLSTLTESLSKKPGAKLSDIQKVINFLGIKPPDDYIAFLLDSNGAEGFMKGGRYLILDSVEQLIPCNEPYGLGLSGPGFVSFGSDGGTMLFAFEIRASIPKIVEVDSVCMDMGAIIFRGWCLTEFLEQLNKNAG